jgi:hypothetical protein
VEGFARFALASDRGGKSGGARVIYCWAVRRDAILLLCVYLKNEAADLTKRQVSQLGKVVKEEFGQ